VRTARLPTYSTGWSHDGVGEPSSHTVQAPHRPWPQPNFAPVRPRVLRRTSSREVPASAVTARLLSLTSSRYVSATACLLIQP
jgi:hypothetical protein